MFCRFLVLVGALFLTVPAASASTGIVVRLSTGGESVDAPVQATLTNAAGASTTLTLLDNGESPDVNAGDFHYSASSMIDGETFQVTLSLGGEAEDVGEVSWSADVTARDLVITRYDGIVTLETGAGDNGQPANEPTAPGSPAGDPVLGSATGAPVANPAVDGTAPARGPNVTFPSSGSASTAGGTTPQNDSTLYVIGGLLLLVLAGVAFFWFREPSTTAGATEPSSTLLHRMPEPGLLGEGTPALTDGASVWVVDAASTTEFMTLLLSSIAAHHRVVVVAPGSNAIPVVHGGPVYRMKTPRAGHVADAIADLMRAPGQPVAVLVDATRMEESIVSDYADLVPGELGTVFVRNTAHTGPERSLHVTKTEAGWSIVDGDTRVELRINEWGIATEQVG
ncbi:MAG: hypothetical protein VX944_16740 [Myxococcota bacterium]|nr:hypothetical protein [Myxococcota bacterium]